MDDLSNSLDNNKWQKMDPLKKTDFLEYHVMRQHKQLGPTSFSYMVVPEGNEDSKRVQIQFTLTNKDPLKDIATVELRLDDDKIVGIDIDGDCFELIGK
ncbi:hypothetical protein ACOMHN_047532 [Nucella lapillus]